MHGGCEVGSNTTGNSWTHHTTVDEEGRLFLPLELRRRKELEIGSAVLIIEFEDKIEICTTAQALRKAQEYFLSVIPADVSLVDELIAERREEAKSE